jgi:hypothetical protein
LCNQEGLRTERAITRRVLGVFGGLAVRFVPESSTRYNLSSPWWVDGPQLLDICDFEELAIGALQVSHDALRQLD